MKKKIALIGNMNNNFFSIARYLRDRSYQADLFLIDELDHFLPDSDTYNDDYKKFTFELIHDSYSFNNTISKVKEQLSGYDYIIGTSKVPAVLSENKIKLNMFIPHGQDVFSYPFYEGGHKILFNILSFINNDKLIHKIFWKLGIKKFISLYDSFLLSKNQTKGLKSTDVIISNNAGHIFKSSIQKIGFKNKLLTNRLPIIYTDQYSSKSFYSFQKTNKYFNVLSELKNEKTMLLFHHSRHSWENAPSKFFENGNDLLIKGFAKFIQKNPTFKIKLVTLEYGNDFLASKKLVKELNIEDYVMWLPKMCRKEIMSIIPLADLGAVSFSMPWTSGGVLYEYLSMGIPFLQCDTDKMKNDSSIYPYISANNDEEICGAIEGYIKNKDLFINSGEIGKKWFLKNVVQIPMEIIINEIES